MVDCLKLALSMVNLRLKQLSFHGTYRISMTKRTTLCADKFNLETKVFSNTYTGCLNQATLGTDVPLDHGGHNRWSQPGCKSSCKVENFTLAAHYALDSYPWLVQILVNLSILENPILNSENKVVPVGVSCYHRNWKWKSSHFNNKQT